MVQKLIRFLPLTWRLIFERSLLHTNLTKCTLLSERRCNYRKPSVVNFRGGSGAVDKIMDILDISKESAEKIVKADVNEENVTLMLKVLTKYGFTRNAIVRQPRLLRLTPVAVENYILILKESGISNIEPKMIYRFSDLCKRSIPALQSQNLIPKQADIVKNYCQILELSPSIEERIWDKLPTNNEQVSLLQLRQVVMSHYFADTLDTTTEATLKLMKIYPRTYYRSFAWVKETIRILFHEFDFSKETICKHGYLLQSNPENLSEMLRTVKTLSSVDIKKIAHVRPKILMSLTSSLLEIQSMFEKYSITPEAILKYPEVYTLSPTTIKNRLEEINSIPQFAALKQHPRIGRLIYYQNKIKSRLDYLTSNNITGASLHILSTDSKRFDKFISYGEQKSKGIDVIYYLAEYFRRGRVEIRKKLMLQPNWLQIPLMRIESSLQLFIQMNAFSKDRLFDCLPILLYPKDRIQIEIQNVLKEKEASLEDKYFLDMVLYFLERQVHFTGDGVWPHKVGEEIQVLQEYSDPHPAEL